MKNLVKSVKTLAAGIAATALIPCGLLTAQAVTPTQYAVVIGHECQITFDGMTPYGIKDLDKDADRTVFQVPSSVKTVQAHCLNGQGDVPLTSSPDVVGVNYIENPTESDPIFVTHRMPPAAVEAPTEAPLDVEADNTVATQQDEGQKATVSDHGRSQKATVTQTHKDVKKTTRAPRAHEVVRKNGKVIETTTPSGSNRSAAVVEATDMTVNNSSEGTGTASQDIAQEDASAPIDSALSADNTNTSDEAVDGQNIEASQYAVANLSLVDRMGGAGTMVGIAILGLIGAAGAISLTRSIILG